MAQSDWHGLGPFSIAMTESERDDQIARARKFCGQAISKVQYLMLDYRSMDHKGLRVISDEAELLEPTWRCDGFDCIDLYLQIDTEDQESFTIGWDVPSEAEGVWLREGASLGEPFSAVAVWDVSTSPRWAELLGSQLTDIEFRYRTEEATFGWFNELITLTIGKAKIYVFLGEVNANKEPTPSVNNLMVMSDTTSLPDWLSAT
ncbi:MAG: hypothetical protein WA860_06765 [Acidimicrobiales bacterium]